MRKVKTVSTSLREVQDKLDDLIRVPRPAPTLEDLISSMQELEKLLQNGVSVACQAVRAEAARLSREVPLRHRAGGDELKTLIAASVVVAQVQDNFRRLGWMVGSAGHLLSQLETIDGTDDLAAGS